MVSNEEINVSNDLPEKKVSQVATTYDAASFKEALNAGTIGKIQTGLLDVIASFGSTELFGDKEDGTWRKQSLNLPPEVGTASGGEPHTTLSYFNEVVGASAFNPYSADDKWDPEIEALAMKQAVVVNIRADNPEHVKDGSLGSLYEMAVSALSAKLRGQRVVITFAPGYEESIQDEAAITQFQVLKTVLKLRNDGNNFIVKFDCSREENVELVRDAYQKQKNEPAEPLSKERVEKFHSMLLERLKKPNRKIIIGGSSRAYSPKRTGEFKRKREAVEDVVRDSVRSGDEINILYEGESARPWEAATMMSDMINDPESWQELSVEDKLRVQTSFGFEPEEFLSLSEEEQYQRLRNQLSKAAQAEQQLKDEADIVYWEVLSDATTLAGATEVALFPDQALESGQLVVSLLEDFDEDDYTRSLLEENTETLKHEFANDEVVMQLIQDLNTNPNSVTYKRVKGTSLKSTKVFRQADIARRIRNIATQQIKQIKEEIDKIAGDQGIEVAVIARSFDEFLENVVKFSAEGGFEGREEYFQSYRRFKTIFEALVRERGKKEEVLVYLGTALQEEGVGFNEAAAQNLLKHLREVRETSAGFQQHLSKYTNNEGDSYLSDTEFQLLTDIVAPTHDFAKLFGRPDQQVVPHHEILMGQLISNYFGELGYTEQEVDFMSFVVSKHETVYDQEKDGDPRSTISKERAVSLFEMIDCFGKALQWDESGQLFLEPIFLKKRFTDLYVRHIKPSELKIPRPMPKWGLKIIQGAFDVIDTLQQDYGVSVAENFKSMLIEAGMQAIEEALKELKEDPEQYATQIDALEKVQTRLAETKTKN